MDEEAFKDTVIDRLARIEERQNATMETLKSINDRLCQGDTRMDYQDKRITTVEQTLNHPETGLVKTVSEMHMKVDNINLKAAALGGAAGLASFLGLSNLGWISQIFTGK